MTHLLLAMQWVSLAIVALFAATLAAVSGFGGAAVLLPALVAIFGIREVIPILTVAQLIGNGARVWFNGRELNWSVIGWFTVGAVPLGFARRISSTRIIRTCVCSSWFPNGRRYILLVGNPIGAHERKD